LIWIKARRPPPRMIYEGIRTHDDTLERLPLFRGVAPQKLAALARAARVYELARGEALVHRGEPLPGFCALAAGALKLAVSVPPRGERVLGLVGDAASFGEALALRRKPCSFDVVALADARVIALPVSAIESLVAAVPRFAHNLLELLAERTLELQAELEAGLLQRAPQRLASYLCSLARPAEEGAWRASLPVSKTVVAAMLGIKKETLSRLLRDLVERRLIAVSRREIIILDPQALCGKTP
jgi:CRP/FNR family transcriptional regulator